MGSAGGMIRVKYRCFAALDTHGKPTDLTALLAPIDHDESAIGRMRIARIRSALYKGKCLWIDGLRELRHGRKGDLLLAIILG